MLLYFLNGVTLAIVIGDDSCCHVLRGDDRHFFWREEMRHPLTQTITSPLCSLTILLFNSSIWFMVNIDGEGGCFKERHVPQTVTLNWRHNVRHRLGLSSIGSRFLIPGVDCMNNCVSATNGESLLLLRSSSKAIMIIIRLNTT